MSKQCVRAVVINDDKMLVMKRNKFGMEYATLIGGGIEIGEDQETALRRELREETGLQVGQIRLMWTENAGDMYGEQYVYLCEYIGGEPQLAETSPEKAISAMGKNLYVPTWLPVAELAHTTLRSGSLKQALLSALQNGFPEAPQRLDYMPETVGQ